MKLNEGKERLFGNHEMWMFAAGKEPKPFALLTEPHDKLYLGQFRKLA